MSYNFDASNVKCIRWSSSQVVQGFTSVLAFRFDCVRAWEVSGRSYGWLVGGHEGSVGSNGRSWAYIQKASDVAVMAFLAKKIGLKLPKMA